MDDSDLADQLRRALERIETLEGEVRELRGGPTPHAAPAPSPVSAAAPSGATRNVVGRRHLIGRAGTAAVGAVLGGTAATIAAASPAAAATGSFDTTDTTPALTATTSGPDGIGVLAGPAVNAVSTGAGRALLATSTTQNGTSLETKATGANGYALRATGRTTLDGNVSIDSESPGNALDIRARGAQANGIAMKSDGYGALFLAAKTGLWSLGDVGVIATGTTTQLLLRNDPNGPGMPAPPTRNDAHETGEIYLDDNGTLWLCTAGGTPGTGARGGGTGPAGAFTVLPTPVRVYDTRPGSGKPGAGTGPVTGTRHDIDLTANTSGLPTDATAALVTLTATNTIANPNAYGQIYANGLTTPPDTSSINWTTANTIIATTTTTALTDGKVAFSMNPGANVLIDVLGYYR